MLKEKRNQLLTAFNLLPARIKIFVRASVFKPLRTSCIYCSTNISPSTLIPVSFSGRNWQEVDDWCLVCPECLCLPSKHHWLRRFELATRTGVMPPKLKRTGGRKRVYKTCVTCSRLSTNTSLSMCKSCYAKYKWMRENNPGETSETLLAITRALKNGDRRCTADKHHTMSFLELKELYASHG